MKSPLRLIASQSIAALSSLLLAGSCLVYAATRPEAPKARAEGRAAVKSERAAAKGEAPKPKAPLDFVENRGQWDAAVKFATWRGAMAASFEKEAIKLRAGKERPLSVVLGFEGASKGVTLAGEGERGGRYNFFVGNDRAKWRSNVGAFGGVLYRGLYEGIDLRVREAGGRLEYDLILAPGANLEKVVIRAGGTTSLEVADDGSLVMRTAGGELRQTPPLTWEELPNGERRIVECRFRKIDARRYGFVAPRRDRGLPLVVDPGLEWSTYLGGGDWDEVHEIAAAGDGLDQLL